MAWISQGAGHWGGSVANHVRLCEVVLHYFAPISIVHRQRVALVLHLSGCCQLVGGVISKTLREALVVQPWASGSHLRHVAHKVVSVGEGGNLAVPAQGCNVGESSCYIIICIIGGQNELDI